MFVLSVVLVLVFPLLLFGLLVTFLGVVLLRLAHVVSQHANLIVLVLVEVEAELPAEPDLQQVVIEALLANADLRSGFFQRQPRHLIAALFFDAGVVLPPFHNLIDDVAYAPLLRPTALVVVFLLPFLVLSLLHHCLVHLLGHELVDQRHGNLVGLDLNVTLIHIFLVDEDVFVDGIVAAVYVDLALRQVV